jgi:protein-S-isoprenylcysteine O-methyltransferase Ste14
MRKSRAALGSILFFVLAPGTVIGLVPWLITGWDLASPFPGWIAAQVAGAALVCAGLVPAVRAFVEFARAGGTPAPVAPTEHLVVSGPNRYVRNPMYVGLLSVLVGQALLFSSVGVLLYAVLAWAVTASFVRWYEEPTLVRDFGAEYESYRAAVPAWIPRLRPWSPV